MPKTAKVENVQYLKKETCLLVQSAEFSVSSGHLVKAVDFLRILDDFALTLHQQ